MTNPVFNQSAVDKVNVLGSEPMTINGTINKTFVLFALLLASSLIVWNLFAQGAMDKVVFCGFAGIIMSIIAFFAIMLNPRLLPIAAPVYALSQGLALGGLSAYYNQAFSGIVMQAIVLTFMVLFSMLFLYRIKAIKCTEKLRSVIMISTLSIGGIYLVSILGSFFGLQIPQIFTSSYIGIGFSLLVVGVASLNLIIDFDFIERGTQNMLSKEFEWYGAFGLMVTLVWLYIEILRLLAKLRDR